MRTGFKTAVLPLLGLNILAFILQTVIPGFTESFMLLSKDVLLRPWILITSMFLHADPTHLIFNMYALFIFGPLVEQKIGSKRFLTIYLASGFLASLISVFFYPAALGASGAIMGILGVTIMLLPQLKVLFFFVIPMSLRTAGIIFALIDLLGAFGLGMPGIANVAHLVGLGIGVGYGWFLLKKRTQFRKNFMQPSLKKSPEINEYSSKTHLSDDDVKDYIRYGRI